MAVWKKASLHVLNVWFLSAFHRCSCWHPLDLLCACVHKFFPGETRTQPLVSAIFHLTRFLQLFYQLLEDNRVDKQKPFKYVLTNVSAVPSSTTNIKQTQWNTVTVISMCVLSRNTHPTVQILTCRVCLIFLATLRGKTSFNPPTLQGHC